MVAIPSGQFMMGDRYPGYEGEVAPHRVSVADFAIGRYEVTFDEWDACVRGGGCVSNPNPSDQGWGRGRRPVINVSWNDAQEYVRWLSARTGQSYRLPSEAEWEYSDNAPRDFQTPHGRTASESTVPVGSSAPNFFGVYDKTGNVREWVEDAWRDTSDDATNDGAARITTYDLRILRGFSWRHERDGYSESRQDAGLSDRRREVTGLRVALSLTGVRNPNPLPAPLSGPLEPPLEGGYYVYGGSINDYSIRCGDYQNSMTLTGDVALHASRDPATPVVATLRSGESVNIADCRVHFRPRRGEVLRTDYGFEAGRPVYLLYDNRSEWDAEYFEHDEVFDNVWHQGEIIEVRYGFPEDMFSWEPQDGARAVCWFQLEARGVRGWGQSADIDCYWTRRWGLPNSRGRELGGAVRHGR